MTLSSPETEMLEMYRGDIQTWEFTATQDGVALNLTGATIRFVVRPWYPLGAVSADTDALILATVGAGITVTNAAGGIFEVEITKSNTYSWNIEKTTDYRYGVEVVLSGSTDPVTIGYGVFRVYPDIVRA